MRDLFEELLETLERTAFDNKVTITNVKLFVDSWRKEQQLELENQLFMLTTDEKPPVIDLSEYSEEETVVISDSKLPFMLQTITGHYVPQMIDLLSEYGLTLRVVKRDGIPLAITDDVKQNRINVETENGMISKVIGRG